MKWYKFFLLHKIQSVAQPGHAPVIKIVDNQRKRPANNATGRKGLPILVFSSRFWRLLQLWVERRCAAVSAYCAIRCTPVVCLSILGSNALFAFDSTHRWLFQLIIKAHSTRHRDFLIKCRAWFWGCEYLVWPSTWKHGRDSSRFFCV